MGNAVGGRFRRHRVIREAGVGNAVGVGLDGTDLPVRQEWGNAVGVGLDGTDLPVRQEWGMRLGQV